MIKVRVQIDNGDIVDIFEQYGLVFIKSDTLFEAPIKKMEATSYPEEEGEHLTGKTVSDAFDYKVTFFVQTNSISNANEIINQFNKELYTQVGDMKIFKCVSFYDDYKKVKIVGFPSLLSEGKDFFRDTKGKQYDIVLTEWKIRVMKPSLCDFNLQ